MPKMSDEKAKEKITETEEEKIPETEETTEAPVAFQLKAVKSKPKRKYRKGSKYDALLDAFLKSSNQLVEVAVEGKDANYLRTQLNKRIEARNLKLVCSVLNNALYLEKPQ